MKKTSTVEYFWSKIDIRSNDECWETRNVCIHKTGYPIIKWNRKGWTCRKLAYHLTFPDITIKGKLIQYCENKLCCNPHHMYDSGLIDGERICANCGVRKSLNDFGWAITGKRKDTVCKPCNTIIRQKYFADPINRKKNNDQRRKHRPLIKDKLNEKARNDPNRAERQSKWARQNVPRKLWHAAKTRAAKKKLPFNISPEDIVIPAVCPVLGIQIVRNKGNNGSRNASSPSVDRIYPELGYIKGNVRVISLRANILKNNATLAEIELLLIDAKKISQR